MRSVPPAWVSYAVENGRMVKTKDGFREWAVTIIAANAGDEGIARSVAADLSSDETTTELSTNPDGTFWYVNFVRPGIDKATGSTICRNPRA